MSRKNVKQERRKGSRHHARKGTPCPNCGRIRGRGQECQFDARVTPADALAMHDKATRRSRIKPLRLKLAQSKPQLRTELPALR